MALLEHTRVKGICDSYEPGSIVKPLTLAICLKANRELERQGKPPLFDPKEKVGTQSGRFPGRRDLKDPRGHKYLNMYMALQKSSNVYFARIVDRVIQKLGNEWYKEQLEKTFKLGVKTGIEFPAEAAGVLPEPGRIHPNGTLEWSIPTPYSLAMGHNLLVTSLQMLRSYAVFANGGYLVQPTLIRKIIKMDDEGSNHILLDNAKPDRQIGFPQVLDSSIIDEVVTALKYVTKPGGSGHKAEVYGYSIAGKTGSANKIVEGAYSKKKYLPSFVGFIPVNNPLFVMLVVIDEPNPNFIPGVGTMYWGGQSAAPVFREIARRSLQYMGAEPDNPYGFPRGDPRYDPNKAFWGKEIKEMAELYKQWNEDSK